MQNDTFRRLLPYSGIISALLIIAAVFGVPSAPQVGADNHAEVIAYYSDHTTALAITNIGCGLLAAFFLVPLLTELRATLRSGEAGESTYSTLVTIGGSVLTFGLALMAMTAAAASSAADSGLGGDSILSLAAVTDYSWMPWVVGMAVVQWAVGLGGLRTATLPKWISWFSIVLGALCLTGVGGIGVFFLAPIWMIAISVVLIRAQSAAAGAPRSAAPAPAAS